jgi:hypothetical protein
MFGGTSKSWLLRKLRAELPKGLPSALLDFELSSAVTSYHTDPSRALAELGRQIDDVECPPFDLAYSLMHFQEGVTDEPLMTGKGLVGMAAPS